MDLTPEKLKVISKGDPEIYAVLMYLYEQNIQLQAEVRELKRQLGQNSNNSSKPPSSDGFKRKTNNLREKGGKPGAPKGHPGHTLEAVAHPDTVVEHRLMNCPDCHADLEGVAVDDYERRQVFELPEIRLWVTEHRAEKKSCPVCHGKHTASFPAKVKARVQYGDTVTAMTAYLSVYQTLPLERISQFYDDLTGIRPSEATLLNQLQMMSDATEPVRSEIRDQLKKLYVIHADESPMKVGAKQHWIHVVSNADWTLITSHSKRGSEAFDEMGVLPEFTSHVVHDGHLGYYKDDYHFIHVSCNAHHMRECQGIVDNDNHQWAREMKQLLKESWERTRTARRESTPLREEELLEIERCYDDILKRGEAEWSRDPVPMKTGPRGRKAHSRATNLGNRMIQRKPANLRFLRDDRIPFDNNQAERDMRMSKVKQKISGIFRTPEGLAQFASIRSVISTFVKQDLPLMNSLVQILCANFRFTTS